MVISPPPKVPCLCLPLVWRCLEVPFCFAVVSLPFNSLLLRGQGPGSTKSIPNRFGAGSRDSGSRRTACVSPPWPEAFTTYLFSGNPSLPFLCSQISLTRCISFPPLLTFGSPIGQLIGTTPQRPHLMMPSARKRSGRPAGGGAHGCEACGNPSAGGG